jgi:glycosyltransferase involved in cell wall biosynthesis
MSAEVVCIAPFWSQSDALNWDSNYQLLRRTLPKLAELEPDWLWVVLWPQRSVGQDQWRWKNDGLFDHPRIVRFPWAYDTSMRMGTIAFDPQRFAQLEEKFAPTTYLLMQVELGAFIAGGFRGSYARISLPRIVAQHHYVIHPSLGAANAESHFPRLWAQLGGTIAADRVLMNSRHAENMLRETAKTYLNGVTWEKIALKTRVVPFGLLDERVTSIVTRKHDTPVIVFNHRFEQYKRPQVTADLLRRLRGSGQRFEVWVTQHVDQKISQMPVDRIVGDPDYLTYLDNIAVPAINTLNSVHETFCISVLDSMALGHVIVAPRGVTFPELLPYGYPYLFKDEHEQERMIVSILKDWPRAVDEWGARLRKHAAENFTLDVYAHELIAELRTDIGEYVAKTHVQRKLDAFFDALPRGRYALSDACRAYRKATGLQDQAAPNRRVLRDFLRRGAVPSYDDRELAVLWRLYERRDEDGQAGGVSVVRTDPARREVARDRVRT